MEMNVLNILYDLSVILLATKFLGLATRRIGLPQVVGMVIAGLLIGPAIVSHLGLGIDGLVVPTGSEMDTLKAFSQVGVCLILFSSGLETDIGELKKSGGVATLIALCGVLVPLGLGTVGAMMFMGGFSGFSDPHKLLNALFVGCILAATSVGITVETLRECGKLTTRIGTVVLSAAIIDDVIGIVALSVITSLKSGSSMLTTLLSAAGFFAFSIGLGLLLRALFRWLGKTRPHRRRTGIFAFGVCFLFAYYAEAYFGISAITGAYMAGLMLSGLTDTTFVDRKAVVSGYMLFTPIFFALIGISADFSRLQWSDLAFGAVFVLLGIAGKIIGCGGMARLNGFSRRDSLTVGCGMIARGEVALAVYASGASLIYTGADGSILGIDPLVAVILLILTSSILCPILLKFSFQYKRGTPIRREESSLSAKISRGKEGG